MRKYLAIGLAQLFLLAGCGGGGHGGGSTTTPPPPPPPPPKQVIAGPGPNVVTLTVNAGPANSVNTGFISVTLCAPGSTTNCQTVDGIEVDTGSFGFRVIASALNTTLLNALPQQVAGSVPVAECAEFADGYSWGSVRAADLTVSSETASNIPIQLIGDPAFPTVPSDCTGAVAENTVQTFGANGILGVGPFIQDCGPACVTIANPNGQGFYYTCPTNASTCSNTVEPLDLQVSNPVAAFTASGDTNGVILELPAASEGAASATGALVFGIGTQSNNGLSGATVLALDPNTGVLDVSFNSGDFPASYLDSGSNAIYFTDSALSVCAAGTAGSGFYCSDASLTAQINGQNSASVTADFAVSNATNLFSASPTGTAFVGLGAPLIAGVGGATFDFGLPYFYGRNVFTAIAGQNTPGGTGPYVAY